MAPRSQHGRLPRTQEEKDAFDERCERERTRACVCVCRLTSGSALGCSVRAMRASEGEENVTEAEGKAFKARVEYEVCAQ